MNTAVKSLIFITTIVIATAAGYWLGHPAAPHPDASSAKNQTTAPKILYYRNPMGLADTSPTPKKDPMGMDYIPVYAEGSAEPNTSSTSININAQKIQQLGVKTEAVTLRTLETGVNAVGQVAIDESRTYAIAPRFEGWVERLHVNITGQEVAKGQALFEAYSPELVSAQNEYAIAAQGTKAMQSADANTQQSMQQLADSSLSRLRNWEMSEGQIKALTQSGKVQRTITYRSPVRGIVMTKKAVQGMRFMPGENLFEIADLSHVWVVADVFEQDLARLKLGAMVTVSVSAYPGKTWTGKISYIYPTIKPETRSVPIRVELANGDGLLKPAMYAKVQLSSPSSTPVLSVPVSAIIDSGTRQIALVQVAAGQFEPREVSVGQRSAQWLEIRSGLKEGEEVVTAANFLIDAESNLKAALSGLQAPKPVSAAKIVGHKAHGEIEAIDIQSHSITLSHGPVASLKWPAMTMDFVLANPAMLDGLKPGSKVDIEFVERDAGEWVITKIQPAAQGH